MHTIEINIYKSNKRKIRMQKQQPPEPFNLSNNQALSLLSDLLSKTIQAFTHQGHINQIINHAQECRQRKALAYFVSQNGREYMQGLWREFYHEVGYNGETRVVQITNQEVKYNEKQEGSSILPLQEAYQVLPVKSIQQLMLEAAVTRQTRVYQQILHNNLTIPPKQSKKPTNPPLQQPTTLNESKATSHNSQKDFFQFIKQEKLNKEKRKKLLEGQQKKQQERQKQQREQEQRLEEAQSIKRQEEKRKKEQELLMKREKLKEQAKRHQSLYESFQTNLYHLPKQPSTNTLHLLQRFQSSQLKKLKEQKQKLYKSYQKPLIDHHQTSYLSSITKRHQARYTKMQQIKHLQHLQNEQSRVKFRSSFKFEKPEEEYQRKKRQQFLAAKQKRDRILEYKQKVRSDFVPQVDQFKKMELVKMVEGLERRDGVVRKRVVREGGEVVVEDVEVKDAREVGLGYLQGVKEQVERIRAQKKQQQNSTHDDMSFDPSTQNDPSSKHPSTNPPNYLQQLRQHRAKSTTAHTSFTNTKTSHLSFQQKLKKIKSISQKLLQKTKQQEMMLKYGKFKTSEEILLKKEAIDRSYIELVNMKLEMIGVEGD